MKIKSILGQRFGRLTVLAFSGINKHGSSLWICRCDCGLTKSFNRMHLVKGEATYCGRANLCPMQRLENFFEKVAIDHATGCWEWTAGTIHFGYGMFALSGGKSIRAHIASYKMFVGEVPDGCFVLHKCDNPPCVNPLHLFLGTQRDNMTDKVLKGRQARGSSHGMSKLTEDEVSAIRSLYAGGTRKSDIARQFALSRTHVGRIVAGAVWSHLEPQCLSTNGPV